MKKSKWILLLMSVFLLMFSINAYAFDDISNESGKDAILNLYQKGIISGISKTQFAPTRSLSYAEAVTLFVKAFDLKLDHIKFIKAPVASDTYSKIKDDAWYANAFVAAYYNGVTLPREIDPNAAMSKEEFAHYLYQILSSKVEFATIKIYHNYADVDQVNETYRNSINDLLSLKIIILNKNDQFQPKKAISRAEAAVMLYNTIEQFGEEIKNPIIVKPLPPVKNEEVEVTTQKVSDEVNKVTLSWGEKGSTGYSISIDSIAFDGNVATIYYTLHYPDPNKFYATVITYPKASTYVASGYTINTVQSNYYTLPYEKPKFQLPVIEPDKK